MMEFRCIHCNINVTDLEKSIAFYKKALSLSVVKEKESADGSFKLVYLNDGITDFQIELTWLKNHPEHYDLGENESHICFQVEDYDSAYELHKQMDCICFENKEMELYFINDPDDYWIEIVPVR